MAITMNDTQLQCIDFLLSLPNYRNVEVSESERIRPVAEGASVRSIYGIEMRISGGSDKDRGDKCPTCDHPPARSSLHVEFVFRNNKFVKGVVKSYGPGIQRSKTRMSMAQTMEFAQKVVESW